MAEKRYGVNVAMILGVSAALLLFIFILVSHHRDIPNQVQQRRSVQLGAGGSSVAERIKPVGQVVVGSGETQQAPAKVAVAASPPSRDGQQVYQAGCIACHDTGVAGAPKLGDKGEWAKRIAKGLDALYASAVKGVQGSAGVMPAKGGNPTLTDAEVKAAVDYMTARSK